MDCYPIPVDNNLSRKRQAEPAKWKRNLAKRQSPQKHLDIISRFSTVTKLGVDCEVLDWKTASQEVFKPVGNWHFQFKLCKRFILRRSKRAGNVLIGGHLYYKTDDEACKNVCERGKSSSMLNQSKINPSCTLSDVKKKDILTLKSHWGNDWQQNEELLFFKTLLNDAEIQVECAEDS
ncbi:unnamed protein product [Arctia plantaginis]|uniref:Uncharacterized protein n=1 Tax=Arctia plantaginis TaxID=874455 RepID=A0A8S0ZET9_ARCPL|nr:unnamed protein product [Arctia plantaginis]